MESNSKTEFNVDFVNICVNYDEYSLSNIGVGVSTQLGPVNFYGMVDNITKIIDIAGANSISVQFGLNLIFN